MSVRGAFRLAIRRAAKLELGRSLGALLDPGSEPPILATDPIITGTAQQGETLTISTAATWTGETVASVAYRWQRNAGAGQVVISGATASTYTLQAADVGATVRAQVQATGTNGLPSGWASSNATGTVAAWLPILTGASFADDPVTVGDVVALDLQLAHLPASVSTDVTVSLAKDAELTGPTSATLTISADAFGVGSASVNYTAATAGDATVTATLNGSAADDTVSIAAAAYNFTDTFDGTNGQILRTRPNWAVLPSGETTVSNSLVLDGAGGIVWTSTSSPNAGVMVVQDAGSMCQTFEVVIKTLGVTGSQWLAVGASDESNAVLFEIVASGNNNKVYKRVAGVNTLVAAPNAMGITAGSVVRVELDVNTAGGVEGMRIYVNGVEKTTTTLVGADWSGLVVGTKAGITGASRRGSYESARLQARQPVAVLSSVVVDKVMTPEGQAVAVGETTALDVHVTGLTPNTTQSVLLEVLAGPLQGDVCVQGQAVTKLVKASKEGTAWVHLRVRGGGTGQQAIAVRSRINTLSSQMHSVQMTGMTMPATATAEDPLRVELSFSGLPPNLSQKIPVVVSATAGLYFHRYANHVMVKADGSGNGVGVLGGFASAAGVQTLQVHACGTSQTATCTVTALDLSGALRMSNPATYGGTFPAAGADVTLPTGLLLWDLTTAPNWGSLTVPADCRVYSDDEITALRLSADEIIISEHATFSRRGRFVVGRAAAPRPWNTSAIIEATGALPTLTAIVLPGGLPGGGFFTSDLSRSISVKGDLILHGQEHAQTWATLAATAAAGSNTLVIEDAVTWLPGSKISVGITEYASLSGASEEHTIQAISPDGKTITLAGTLARRRWGQKTYMTNTGVQTAAGATDALPALCPTVLRDVASVSLLTQPITIQGKDDSHWTNGWGVTTICHNRDSAYWMTGTAFVRYGAKVKEHYAYHGHFPSYQQLEGDFGVVEPVWLGDTANFQVHGCSFNNGIHRGWTQHGATGPRITNCVIRGAKGHAMMQEEGAEFNLSIDRVLVQDVTAPDPLYAILESDKEPNLSPIGVPESAGQTTGPAGMWMTNPQISITNCRFETCGVGKWNALSGPIKPLTGTITKPSTVTVNLGRAAVEGTLTLTATSSTQMTLSGITTGTLTKGTQFIDSLVSVNVGGTWTTGDVVTIPVEKAYVAGCLGLSSRIDIIPFHLPPIDDRGNVSVFNRHLNMLSGFNVVDEAGNTAAGRIDCTRTGRPDGAHLPFVLHDYEMHGGQNGNYSNQVYGPLYRRFVMTGAIGTSLYGGTFADGGGRADYCTVIGRTPRMTSAEIALQQARPICAVATYHETMDFAYAVIAHIPANPIPHRAIVSNRTTMNHGGIMLQDDLYTNSFPFWWFSRWFGVVQVDVVPSQRTPSPFLETPGLNWPGILDQNGNVGQGQDVADNRYRRWATTSVLRNSLQLFSPDAPANANIMLDHPFLVTGLTSSTPVLTNSRTIWTLDPFFGCKVSATDTQVSINEHREGIFVERKDASGTVIARYDQKQSATADANILANFHSWCCAADKLAHYRVYNGETSAIWQTVFALQTEGANVPGYQTVFEIPWSGAVPAKVHLGPEVSATTGVALSSALIAGTAVAATAVASLAAVKTTPNSFWQDTANNRVYWRADGGIGPDVTMAALYKMGVTPA